MAERPLTYHWLKLRTVAHPTESLEKVKAALQFVVGTDIALTDTPLETHHGLTQHVLEMTVDRSRHLRDLLARVFALPGALDRLRGELEKRTDDDGVFYVRVGKQEAFAGQLMLTDGEDCVQLRLKMEAYPAGREASLSALTRLLDSGKP